MKTFNSLQASLHIQKAKRALRFARTLRENKVPKKTAIISIMRQHKLRVREARFVYRAALPCRKRHKGRLIIAIKAEA